MKTEPRKAQARLEKNKIMPTPQIIARANIRKLRISAQKLMLVADLIRNKRIHDAVLILEHDSHKGAYLMLKALNSAIGNATNNHGLDPQKLYINHVSVGVGATLKRSVPRARGRTNQIFHRHSSIEMQVAEQI